jgi:hypothetical protein
LKPLPQKFDELESLLHGYRDTLAQNAGVPFVRLVYQPGDEAECQRRCALLEQTLQQRGVPVAVVSCRDVIFAHYQERGWLDTLFAMDREQRDGLADEIARNTRRVTTQRVLDAAERLGRDGVIFLVDTAFLYPYVHLTATLEDVTNRITPPQCLVIFYPGEVDIDGQLLFLGVRPSGYYRTRDL